MNLDKFKYWVGKTFLFAVAIGVLGLLLGGMIDKNTEEGVMIGAIFGVCLGGGIPALLAVWFLFLYMVGEVSNSVKGNSK